MTKIEFAKLIQALEAALVTKPAVKQAHKPISSYKAANKFTPKGKIQLSSRQLKNDVAVAKAFAKQGIRVTPRVDALTYKAWLSKGFRPVKGCHGTFVKGVGTLFHSGQVAPDVQPSKAEMSAEVNSLMNVEGVWVS